MYEYDAMGRNTAVIYPNESQEPEDIEKKVMTFDYANNKLTITDEAGNRTEEYYDMHDRLVRQVIFNGSQEIEVESYYDGLGNNVLTVGPVDRMNPGIKVKRVVSEYNDLNLLKRIVYPEETFVENGFEVTVSPYTRFEYNNAGQKVKEIVSLPGNREQETVFAVDGVTRKGIRRSSSTTSMETRLPMKMGYITGLSTPTICTTA